MCSQYVLPNAAAEKFQKKNFKIRRRNCNTNFEFGTLLFLFVSVTFFNIAHSEDDNDVLTLEDINLKDEEMASDRRRPVNEQEKDILLLDALGRRKGSHHNAYGASQEEDSIMDLLGKSKYSLIKRLIE